MQKKEIFCAQNVFFPSCETHMAFSELKLFVLNHPTVNEKSKDREHVNRSQL